MLLRVYRITDRFALALLKLSAAAAGLLAEGVLLVLGSPADGRGVLGIVGRILGVVALVVLTVLRALWAAVAGTLRVSGRVAAVSTRVVSGVAARAGSSASCGARGSMARRAARAEIDTTVVEDPLRAQNRTLSSMVVVVLVLMIGLVLVATAPRAGTPGAVVIDPGVGMVLNATNTPASAQALIATPIPTATQVPGALRAGGSIAFVVRENGQSDLWAVPVGSRAPIRITNDTADERDPAWSPDGRLLAYASNRGSNWDLYIYDLAANETRRVTFGLTFEAAPTWSPDSVWLAYESYQSGNLDIFILPVSDQNLSLMALPWSSEWPEFSPAWSPAQGTEGRFIAFVSWVDGSQDIFLFSLDTQELTNLTQSPGRDEDHPAWSADGRFIAYSAWDEGREKVFVKAIGDPAAPPDLIGFGREPAWSPDGGSIVAAVDSSDATHLTVYPYGDPADTFTPIIAVPRGATGPAWSALPLPAALVTAGGLPLRAQPLYVEQESASSAPNTAPYGLDSMRNVDAPRALLNERVNDSFDALRQRVATATGLDFLASVEDAFWDINQPAQSGEDPRSWYRTGRAFGINRAAALVGFPPQVEIVREERGVNTYWRVFVRTADEAQSGQLGEPLRRVPWDFNSRSGGDVEAYEQGGKLKDAVPQGYYADLTQLAADYGWQPAPAESVWRANANAINYWQFRKTDGLSWLDAMLEIYLVSELGGYAPTPAPPPVQPSQEPES